MIKSFYKNGDFITATCQTLWGVYSLHNRPTTQAIVQIVKKIEETGEIVHHPFARFAENIAIVSKIVTKN